MKRTLLYAALVFTLVFACAKKKAPEDALIRVGDKYVTVKEFQYRGEFTPHPSYPHMNRNLEKILLNNLIMEKLMVMEFADSSRLVQQENFQGYIKGIKEQKMREQLFYEEAHNKVELDSADIQRRLELSQREYDLEFYSIHDDSVARALRAKVQANPDSAKEIFDSAWDIGERPKWSVKWKDPDHVNIHEALYSGPIAIDSVIGPIPLNHGQWIMMKVVDWKDVLLMGGFDYDLREQEVIEKVHMNKATLAWDQYMRDVMKGTAIEFNPEAFKKMADFLFDLQTAQDDVQKETALQRFWQMEDSQLTVADMPTEEAILQMPFMTINGVGWTIGDFRKAMASHPLVYRTPTADRGKFYNQFRIAVADLVRDLHLNEKAYKAGLDEHVDVERTVEQWRDALIAQYERDQLLSRLGKTLPDTTDPMRQYKLQEAFRDYLNNLREKYHDEIQVNMDAFEELEITNTQLFVMQNQVPYPIAVPNWPMFDTENKVDYNILNSK